MHNGITVIDADGHVMEPNELYDVYLEAKFKPDLDQLKREAAARLSQAFFGIFDDLNTRHPLGTLGEDGSLLRPFRKPLADPPDMRGGHDPLIRLKDMDRERIDIAVLYATVVSSFCALKTVELETAMIRAYHRWLADYCAACPERLKGVAVVPMRAPQRAAEEIKRVAREPWCVGIYLSGHMDQRLLDHPDFGPIWQACEEVDLPACFHGGTARPPYGLGTFELGDNLFLQHCATNPYEMMRAMAALVGGGVLERFTRLRVAFLESGVGWLPYWIDRMDEHYELLPQWVPMLRRKPSEVIRSPNVFISCDPDEATLPYVAGCVGAEHILYASDYPHFDARFPDSVRLTADRRELTDRDRRQILCDNARRLYTRLT